MLIESSDDAVVGLSSTGVITSWNAGAERLFGYSPAEAVGQPIRLLTPANRMDKATAIVAGVLAGERIEGIETERIAKDGQLLQVSLSVSPIRDADGEIIGVAAIVRDLSEQRLTEQALHDSEERYRTVVEALNDGVVMQDASGDVLAFNSSAERILGLTADQLAGSSTYEPSVRTVHEDGSPFLGDERPSMVALRTGRPQTDVVMGIPTPDGPVRWISTNSRPLRHSQEEQPYAIVSWFTDITAYRHTLEELQGVRLEILKRLALAAEYRDDDTYRHTERVGHTAELLARQLGLDDELISAIRLAAPLHDVGKIGIPDRILLKPGKLTTKEFEVMKTHTHIGAGILGGSRSPLLQMGEEIALTHHECWDGSGYPAGLRAEAIPLTGRIVAVVDAFDAMTHTRPYKAASSPEYAVAEIQRASGTQFHPLIVEAFMALITTNPSGILGDGRPSP